MSYFTYILKCTDGTLYTGSTNDIDKRLKQHNGILKGGAKYTRGRRPVILMHVEEFANQKQALQRENEIKKLNNKAKLLLLSLDSTS